MDSNQMMATLIQELDNQNDYPFTACTYRNVVLVGRIRTGKSTIPCMVQDPFHMPSMPGLFAGTRDITFNRIITIHQGNSYFFTIIDSPGLFDAMRNEGELLNNGTIKKYLDECITKDITHIHAFAFVFSSGGGINSEDIQSMIFIQKNYPDLQHFFMLIITHCEERTAEERTAFINEFFQHPEVIRYGLRDFFRLGVHFTGCLRPQLQRNPNIQAARIQARNILEMRKEFLDFLIQRQDTYNIHRQGFPYRKTIIKGFLLGAVVGVLVGYCFK